MGESNASVYEYESSGDIWINKGALSEPMHSAAICYKSGKLYVVGGIVQCLDLNAKQSTILLRNNPSFGCYYTSSIVVDNDIYIFGVKKPPSEESISPVNLYAYNIAQNRWVNIHIHWSLVKAGNAQQNR